jgi:uncharacterized protein
MSSEANKQAVMAAWEAFASRDFERIGAAFTIDAEWIAPKGNATARAMNYPDHMVGRAEITHFISVEFGRLFSRDVSVSFKGFYADGNVVVVEERMRATLASGLPYDNDYCFVFELEGGKIRRVREYMDTAKGDRMIFAGPP